MISMPETVVLVVVAMLGHVLALSWLLAGKLGLHLCRCTIYQLPVPSRQLKRELRNSFYAPLPAVLLLLCLSMGTFNGTGLVSFMLSLLMTAVCAEIWHYFSHRAMHTRPLLWIHREHHKSALPSPFTAISFSLSEKLVFNLGILGALSAIDSFVSLNFYGIAGWYISYLFINSYGHANFEIKSTRFMEGIGRILTSTTYHSLHHARYTGNYGLGTRILDRIFGTEWEDYENVFEQVTGQKKPMSRLKEYAGASPRVLSGYRPNQSKKSSDTAVNLCRLHRYFARQTR